MGDTPKEKPNDLKKAAEVEDSTWEQDQKKREYYYDDAHGYEVYEEGNDDEDD
jgi:hypothetical protein